MFKTHISQVLKIIPTKLERCNLRSFKIEKTVSRIDFVRDFIKPLTASPGLTNFETCSRVLEDSPNGSTSQMV